MTLAIAATGGLRRWVVSLVLIGLLLGATFLAVTAFFPGDDYREKIRAAYVVLWTNTTQQQFTDIMRETPWLYIIPAGGIVFISGWQLPRKFYGRAIFMYIVFGIGFVGGHCNDYVVRRRRCAGAARCAAGCGAITPYRRAQRASDAVPGRERPGRGPYARPQQAARH